MSDPLGELFDLFLKERIYLQNVTPKTQDWYRTAWKAFQKAGVVEEGTSTLNRSHLQGFVVTLRDRGVSARTVNTWLQTMKRASCQSSLSQLIFLSPWRA
jgi:hypothetical protein